MVVFRFAMKPRLIIHPVRPLRGRRQPWPHWDILAAALVGLVVAVLCWLALPQ